MTPQEFIAKWRPVQLTERQTAQEHFIDLCRLFRHPTPVERDPSGETYCFEKGALKATGNPGFADVWKKGYFAFEYKKRRKNLKEAQDQLARYAWHLENPPVHVACDTSLIRVITAFNNAPTRTFDITLDDLANHEKRAILEAVFHDPERLRGHVTREMLTREAADAFSALSERLQHRHPDREAVAHFINQLVFCFFAEDVRLLPEGLFKKQLLGQAARRPERAKQYLDDLFAAMEKEGGEYALQDIAWFNGGLFDGRRALPLDAGEIDILVKAAGLRWDEIDPTIFGTLFERFLDPDKRAQIGAHYTDAEKIMMIVEPVIARPLRREWEAAKAEIQGLLDGSIEPPRRTAGRGRLPAREAAEEVRARFVLRLSTLSILDPACGSGNFLYLALQAVKDLELHANTECEALGLSPRAPAVGPEILRGIEINPLAAELARTTIWIGHIQWGIRNSFYTPPRPILRKLDTIECRDALVSPAHGELPPSADGETAGVRDGPEEYGLSPSSPSWPGLSRPSTSSHAGKGVDGRDKPGHDGGEAERTGVGDRPVAPHAVRGGDAPFVEALWPEAEFIVGNPPFLGGKLLRRGLGDASVERLFRLYAGRVPPEADLVTYWFEKARAEIAAGRTRRAGLVSTNSIRGGANRRVLERVAADAPIFEAWSDEPWIVEGADVRVSLICFTNPGAEPHTRLNDQAVSILNSDLTSLEFDLTGAQGLKQNKGIAFQGPVLVGNFEVRGETARSWLKEPLNPNGKSNSEVLRPLLNGRDINARPRGTWVVDFNRSEYAAATLFQSPFEWVRDHVQPFRATNREKWRRENWWLHGRTGDEFRKATGGLTRYIAGSQVSKHRIFIWLHPRVQPHQTVIAIASEDDCTFGILHSRFHEAWSLRLGTSLEDRPRYTPTTTFETFPFPEGLTPDRPAAEYAGDSRAIRIAKAAKELDERRRAWLNPPDLVTVEPEVVPGYPDRILPKDERAAALLKTRTLTNLYNERPAWLDALHQTLDRAVAAAYGWPEDIAIDDALARLLDLNLARAAGTSI